MVPRVSNVGALGIWAQVFDDVKKWKIKLIATAQHERSLQSSFGAFSLFSPFPFDFAANASFAVVIDPRLNSAAKDSDV